MASNADAHGHGHGGHGHGAHGHAGHGHATPINDAAQHQRTFEAFIHFWVYVFGAAALVLIFLATFNS